MQVNYINYNYLHPKEVIIATKQCKTHIIGEWCKFKRWPKGDQNCGIKNY